MFFQQVQYVRFVNLANSGSTNTAKVLPAISTLNTKLTPTAQQKILIQSKGGQKTFAVIQQPASQAGQTKIVTMPSGTKHILNKNALQHISTQKKILPTRKSDGTPVPTKLIAVVKKEDKNVSFFFVRILS